MDAILLTPTPRAALWDLAKDCLRVSGATCALLRPLISLRSWSDDVDLLIPNSQLRRVLDAFRNAVLAGECHVQIDQGRREKCTIRLWTRDAQDSLSLDLWTAVVQWPTAAAVWNADDVIAFSRRQKKPRRESVSADHEHDEVDTPEFTAIERLEPLTEWCLLVMHLSSRRDGIVSPTNQMRLTECHERLCQRLACHKTNIPTTLMQALLRLADSPVSADAIHRAALEAERYLIAEDPELQHRRPTRWLRQSAARIQRLVHRRPNVMALDGSDGVGKSTLASGLCVHLQPAPTFRVTRKLYRRSLLYQLACGVWKHLGRRTRTEFDDRFSLMNTARAALTLWGLSLLHHLRALFSRSQRRVILLDRSPQSLLILKRCTDQPGLHSSAAAVMPWLPPVHRILLVADYQTVSRRRDEMTRAGHESVQTLLYEQSVDQPCFALTIFCNEGDADRNLKALVRMLSSRFSSKNQATSRQAPLGQGLSALDGRAA